MREDGRFVGAILYGSGANRHLARPSASELLLAELRSLGAQDSIDVKSFIWLIGAGLKNE